MDDICSGKLLTNFDAAALEVPKMEKWCQQVILCSEARLASGMRAVVALAVLAVALLPGRRLN